MIVLQIRLPWPWISGQTHGGIGLVGSDWGTTRWVIEKDDPPRPILLPLLPCLPSLRLPPCSERNKSVGPNSSAHSVIDVQTVDIRPILISIWALPPYQSPVMFSSHSLLFYTSSCRVTFLCFYRKWLLFSLEFTLPYSRYTKLLYWSESALYRFPHRSRFIGLIIVQPRIGTINRFNCIILSRMLQSDQSFHPSGILPYVLPFCIPPICLSPLLPILRVISLSSQIRRFCISITNWTPSPFNTLLQLILSHYS